MPNSRDYHIEQALEDLSKGKYSSVRAAARAHNLHRSTLDRRLHGAISKPLTYSR